jgi:hypothetical protein
MAEIVSEEKTKAAGMWHTWYRTMLKEAKNCVMFKKLSLQHSKGYRK